MRKDAITVAVMALMLNGATAASIGDLLPSVAPPNDPSQANWHGGGHRGGGGGQGGGGGSGGGDGGVIVSFPYPPSGPGASSPYPPGPYPSPGPSPSLPSSAGSNATNQPRPWPVWYYCDQPGGYYPYVKVCAHDWQRLPVMPPPPGSGAPIAEDFWQRCSDPDGILSLRRAV